MNENSCYNNLNVIRHTKTLNIEPYPCKHKSYGMFYRCSQYNYDYHLHCISCGKYLENDITLIKPE